MFGALLMAGSVFLSEVGASLSKKEFENHELGVYSLSLLAYFWSLFIFIIYGLLSKEGIVFSLESLPTFAVRAVLEFVVIYYAIKAIVSAPRSSFTFVRMITIPGLILTDLFLGHGLHKYEIIGMLLILLSMVFLNRNHGISKKGLWFTIVTSILAVFTIALYKYNIDNFNSVAGEQIVMYIIMITVLSIMAKKKEHKTIFGLCKNRKYLIQSLLYGFATGLASVAYMFGLASVVTTFKRAFAIVLSIVSGKMYFHEKHVRSKLIGFAVIVAGIIFITLGQF
jgi:drug/metabolite transporter (DMT)-like permease